MNYYKGNSAPEPEKNNTFLIPGEPIIMNYKMVSGLAHDSLVRCTKCHTKYDLHTLTRVKFGVYLCVYCLQKAA
jgi:hypothetical protein